MIAHFLPYPPVSGGRLRIASLLDWLVDSGYEVSFLLLQSYPFPREEFRQLRKRCKEVYVVELRSMGQRLRQNLGSWARRFFSAFGWGRHYLWNRALLKRMRTPRVLPIDVFCSNSALKKVARIIQAMAEKPKAVFCEYLTTSRLLELPELFGSLKILDTLDAIHKRMAMIERGLDPWLACTPEEEAQYLRRADVVIAIQTEEARAFQKLVPDREVITVGQPFTIKRVPQKTDALSCLLVGSIHEANLEGLQWFQKCIWPLVLREISAARLLIAGSMGEYACAEKSVQMLGAVENLDEVYRESALVAVPILSGSGLKIKLVEALSQGKAVVATEHAALGIQQEGLFLLANDPAAFADHIVTLLKNPALRRQFESKALAFAKENFQREQVYSPLKAILRRYEESLTRFPSSPVREEEFAP